MKNKLYLFFVLMTLSIFSFAQDGKETKPNDKILENFEKKYIGEKLSFGWRKVTDLYITTFQHKGVFKYCSFKANGFWQEAGEAVEKEKIPEAIYNALPELDITAFLVESFKINTYNDQSGYMMLWETEDTRIEFILSDDGKILRKNEYPIPEKKDEKKEETDNDKVDWDDGK